MEHESFFNETFSLEHGKLRWLNACVGTNGFPDTLTYGEGYMRTPEIILEYIWSNNKRGEVDLLVYPMIYCARHGIELFLKKLLVDIASLRNLDAIENEITKIHSLRKLWTTIKTISTKTDIRLNYLTRKSDIYVSNFFEIDDTAQTFRYPESNAGDTHLERTPIINLVRFLHHFNKLRDNLNELLKLTERLKYEYSTKTLTTKFSRRDLIKLISYIGKKEQWRYSLTAERKEWLKDKFQLTSNKQLIAAIDLIQSNRFLSSLIGVEKPLLHLTTQDLLNFKKAWYLLHEDYIKKRSSVFRTDFATNSDMDSNTFNLDEFHQHFKLEAFIKEKYQARFSAEKIADLTALLIIGRQSSQYFPEDYETEYERNIYDARADKDQAFRYVLDNTAAMIYLSKALKMLGCNTLAVQSHFLY